MHEDWFGAYSIAALTLFVMAAEAVNTNNKYCNKEEYVGNPESMQVSSSLLWEEFSSLFLYKCKKNHVNWYRKMQ